MRLVPFASRCAALFLLALALPAAAQNVAGTVAAGAEPRAVAIDPVSHRIYVANEGSNSVTVIDARTLATREVAVGRRPQFIAVNPSTDRVYVSNSGDATLSVIQGATLATFTVPINGAGPITVDEAANRIYVIRLGNADEVTYVDGATHSFYTVATNSFSPVSLAVHRASRRLYVAHYATGDVRAVDLASTSDHPPTVSIGVWSRPVALALDPAANKVYVATEDSRGPIAVIDAATHQATFLTPARPVQAPRAILVNPATHRIYAAFQGEVLVIDGNSHAMTHVPVPTPVALALDPGSNRVYAPSAAGVLSVIDGTSNAVVSVPIPAGARAVAVDAGNGRVAIAGPAVTLVDGSLPPPAPPPPVVETHNVQGLWWGGPAETGWGITLAQQGGLLFATWFTFDTDGSPLWLVMSRGEPIGANAYSGTLYRTTGPAFSEASFDPSRVGVTPVGAATFTFADPHSGTFAATVNGATVTRRIVRQVYSAPLPTCETGGAHGPLAFFQDLWWGAPAPTQSGWGVGIAHQGSILFVTWFTYGPDGRPTWLVGSNVDIAGNGLYTGQLFRVTGPSFATNPWSPSQVRAVPAGSVTLTFRDRDNGTLAYTVDGVSGAREITRQVFGHPRTACR